MFVRIVELWAEKGWEEKNKAEMAKFEEEVKQSPDAILAYKLISRNDPTKFVTMTMWKSKESWWKSYLEREVWLLTKRTRWGRINQNEYDSF